MAKTFTPLYDKVLVRRIENEHEVGKGYSGVKVEGSRILLPSNHEEKPNEGIVEAIGHGRLLEDGRVIPLCVKPGYRILFGKYSGTEIKVGGEELLIMREEEILGVVDKPEEEKF